jgi:hypothetical protein
MGWHTFAHKTNGQYTQHARQEPFSVSEALVLAEKPLENRELDEGAATGEESEAEV